MSEITYHGIDDFPGWKRMEIKTDEGTSKRQYKSPGGAILSNGKWAKLKLDHPGVTAFTEAEVRQYAMKSQDEISVSSYNTSNLAIESGEEEYEWEEEEPAYTEPPPPKQQYVSKEGKKFFPRRKKPNPNKHADPSAQRMKGFYQDVSQQQQREKITEFPMPDVEPNKGFRKNPANSAKSASELAVGIAGIVKILNTLEIAFLPDPRLILPDEVYEPLSNAIANLIEPTWVNKQVGTHIAGANNYTVIGQVLIMHSKALGSIVMEKREAAALKKQGLTNPVQQQPNAAQQSQATTWEQQQQQKQAQMNGNSNINPSTGLPWGVGQGPRTSPGTSSIGGQQ